MQDFGLLLDYLRGELDADQAALVRSRLEREAEFFGSFERLRRTLDVIRCLPSLDGQFTPPQPSPTEELPLVQPRPEFVADLRREYHARGWAAFVPLLKVNPQFAAGLRAEFSVRSLLIALPWLNLRAEFVSALRAEFASRTLVASLPALAVRPEFARALNAEFCVRSLVGSLPMLSVREAFARRVKVALYEASRESAAEPQPVMRSALPLIEPSDSFRRRVFNAIRNAARKPLRDRPARALAAIYLGTGRELSRAMRKSKSLAFTAALHVLAIVAALFVVGHGMIAETASISVSVNSGMSPIIGPATSRGATSADLPGERPVADNTEPGRDKAEIDKAPQDNSYDEAPAPQMPTEQTADPKDYKPVGMGGNVASSHTHSEFAMFRLRGEGRQKKIGYLGSTELYDTLSRALIFLGQHQKHDGYWEPEGVKYVPSGESEQNIQRVELTASAALAFLGDGHSSAKSELGYERNVKLAIAWLLKMQNADGQIGPAENQIVFCHSIALLALVEEYALTGRNDLRLPIRKACRWLAESRANDNSGAFPYKRGQEPSLMTSVWAYMALDTARAVKVPDIDAPKVRTDELLRWFDGISNIDPLKDTLESTASPAHLIPTAAAFSLTFFPREGTYEMRRDSYQSKLEIERPDLRKENDRSNGDMRYLFFGSLSFALQNPLDGNRNSWEQSFDTALIKNQLKAGANSGSYELNSYYAGLYGYVYQAAFAALSIENAYRVSLLK